MKIFIKIKKAYQKRWLVLIGVFLLLNLNTSAQTTLNEYLIIAAESNPELKAAYAEYEAALQMVPQVKTLPDPMFGFNYFIMPLETRTGSRLMDFSLSQQFPWFGTLEARGDVKAQQAMVKFEQFQVRKLNLFYQVKQWYYRLYLIDDQIKLVNENLAILNTFERVALSQFEAGRSGMVNVLKVQIETETLENELLALQDQQSLVKERLNLLMNRPVETAIIIADTLSAEQLIISKEGLLDSILTQNPQLQALIYRESAAEYQKRLANLEGKPDFMVGVTYGVMGKYDNMEIPNNGKDMLMPMISVSLPIYRKKYNAMEREAEYMIEAAQFEQESMANELKLMLQEAWYEYLDAQRRIKLFHRQTKILQQTQDLQLTTFTAAGTDFEEVLRIQRELFDYRLELIRAIVENNIAVAEIERLYGKEIKR